MEILNHSTNLSSLTEQGTIYTMLQKAPDEFQAEGFKRTVKKLEKDISVTRLVLKYLASRRTDTFIFNGEAHLIIVACLLKLLTFSTKGKIIAVDMVLRVPNTSRRKVMAFLLKHIFLKQVNTFVHYFKSLEGYTKYYGIKQSNSCYVPFKSNVFEYANTKKSISHKGKYIFSAGRSQRDYRTLIEAARICKLPTAILYTSLEDWNAHGTFVDIDNLPANVRLIKDSGGVDGWIKGIENAAAVVVPTLPVSICASGIGTYLDAMALGKPVIISKGPGADDVLTEENAVFVNPQDASELAKRMLEIWNNDNVALELSLKGREYALSLGDEQALHERILAVALADCAI